MESYRKPMKKLYRITKNRSNMKTQKNNLLKNDLLQRPEKKKKNPEIYKMFESRDLKEIWNRKQKAKMKKDDMEKGRSEVRKDCSGGGQQQNIFISDLYIYMCICVYIHTHTFIYIICWESLWSSRPIRPQARWIAPLGWPIHTSFSMCLKLNNSSPIQPALWF